MDNETPEIARDDAAKLLGLLASDDEFRARVEKNPSEELEQFGLLLPPDRYPSDLRLPSKRTLAELLVVLLEEDVTGMPCAQIILFVVHGHAMPLVEADAAA